MENFKAKVARFMYGRYGIDQMYQVLVLAALILIVANTFIRSPIISVLSWMVLIWMLYRTLSRDITKRRSENERLLKIWNSIKGSTCFRRIKEFKTRRFRKCPHCKAVLRLQRKTGKHTVKCPRCHKEFEIRIIL